MARTDAADDLSRHRDTLNAILNRFRKGDGAYRMAPGDEVLYRQTVHEIVEILNEELGSNRLSWQVENEFNEGLLSFLHVPSYKSVESIVAVVGAGITKLSRLTSVSTGAEGQGRPSAAADDVRPAGKSMFVSHSSAESDLAKDLALWLEERAPGTKCFCSARPADLPPGVEWFGEIRGRAVASDLCLLLLSPDSEANNWIHFEGGMVRGAGIDSRTVPTIYGGMRVEDLPGTLRHFQVLRLCNPDSFNAFVAAYAALDPLIKANEAHADFLRALRPPSVRLLAHGLFGLLAVGNITTEKCAPLILDQSNDRVTIPARTELGRIVAARITFVPRRIMGSPDHWKLGVQIRQTNPVGELPHLFHFHGGSHQGVTSWTVYFDPDRHLAINQRAELALERPARMELWVSPDGWRVGCVGVGSDHSRAIIEGALPDGQWRLRAHDWSEVLVQAWADGHRFQIDVEQFEIDRIQP